MRKQKFVGWALAAILTTAAFPALAQQDDIPILRPKNQTTKPTSAILLVTCDLACNWKLDGEAKGSIDAGGSAKAKVELGQHVVVATTEDSVDKLENEIEIKTPGQTIVHIALQPVRDARLKAEQQARDKADQEARDKAAREQREKDQQERERVAREEAARPTWTDQATGLMWTKKDNGNDVNWQQAANYCRILRLEGHSDWRLPTIDELLSLSDNRVGVLCRINGSPFMCQVKGNLLISGMQWSNSAEWQGIKDNQGGVWTYIFLGAAPLPMPRSYGRDCRALCVRRSGE
jgi:hypothetical protein